MLSLMQRTTIVTRRERNCLNLTARHMIQPMKTSVLFLFLFLLPSAALAVRVAALPFDASTNAVSEATTNVPFAVDFGTMSRIEFALTLDASLTNAVEVSVGTDADGDGALASDEAAWTFGFDCGRWFCRDAARDRQAEADAPCVGRQSRTFVLRRREMDEAWNLVRVTRRGVADVGEAVVVEGLRPGGLVEIR